VSAVSVTVKPVAVLVTDFGQAALGVMWTVKCGGGLFSVKVTETFYWEAGAGAGPTFCRHRQLGHSPPGARALAAMWLITYDDGHGDR
jgi:hypothetical protein